MTRMPTRRAVLAGGLVTLTPGCLESCTEVHRVRAEPFEPTEDLVDDLDGPAADLAARTIEEGPTSVESIWATPIRDETIVVHDGGYYRIDLVSETDEEIPALQVDLEWEAGRVPPGDAQVIAFEDLPESDRFALDHAVYGGDYGGDGFPERGLSQSDRPIPYPDGRDGSDLAGRQHVWIDWDGRFVELDVHGPDRTTRTTYEYEAVELATSDEAFRAWVADERIRTLDGLTEGEREIVEAAIDDEYEDCEQRSESFQRLQDRLAGADGDGYDVWYVDYEGEWYRLTISRIVYGF